MYNISAFIIAKNEEARITNSILSIKNIAREIIVVDSGSIDKTVDICRQMGAKVIYHEWEGYSKQKAFAESICSYDWVLNIDADEALSQDLQNEIAFIFASDFQDKFMAYRIKFLIVHRKDKGKVRALAPCNEYFRLYNRKFCGFSYITSPFTTHDAIEFKKNIETKTYNLQEVAYHYSGHSIEQLVNKANFYSSQQALDFLNNQRKVFAIRIIFEFLFCFLKAFFIRRYFIFGLAGFVDSMIFAFARFLKFAKAQEYLEKQNENNI